MTVVRKRKLLDADIGIDVRDITHICRSASITLKYAPMGTIAARLPQSIVRAGEEKPRRTRETKYLVRFLLS